MIRMMILLSLIALGTASPLYAADTSSDMNMMSGNTEKDDGMMTKMMNEMMMKKLGNKDANYDERFIDLMIPHHESAIMMAQDALKKSDRPEIKKMAQDIITTQEKEIAELKEWRKQWYGH